MLVTVALAGACVVALVMGPGRWGREPGARPKTAADARQEIRLAALNESNRAIRDGDASFLARIEFDGERRIPGISSDDYDRCFRDIAGTVSLSNDPRLYPENDPRRYELYFEVFNAAMRQHLIGVYGTECPAARR